MSHMRVRIGGDASEFQRALKSVEGSAKGVGRNIASAISSPLGMALGGAGITAGIIAMGRSAITAADEVDEGSQRIGVSAETYQRLGNMAQLAGSSIERMTRVFARMARVIVGADEESKGAQKSLERLGLTVDNLKGKKPEEQFEIIARRLATISNVGEQAAAAQEIFGRSALEMIPLINNYDELADKAGEIPVMTDEAVAAAGRYNDALDEMGKAMQSIAVNSGLVEYLAQAAEGMAVLVNHSKNFSAEGAGAWDKFADKVKVAAGIIEDSYSWLQYVPGAGALVVGGAKMLSGKTSAEAAAEQAIAPEEVQAAQEAKAAKDAQKAEEDRMAAEREQQASIDKAIEEALAEEEKLAAAREKEKEATAKLTESLEHQLRQQKLIADGKEREAAIEAALYQARQRNSDLSEEEAAQITKLAGSIHDLKQPIEEVKEESAAAVAPEFRDERQAGVTALERIGAIMGGGAGDQGLNLQREVRNINQRQLAVLENIRDKDSGGTIQEV
jgi:flagellar biosynthesis GTPase FlhF